MTLNDAIKLDRVVKTVVAYGNGVIEGRINQHANGAVILTLFYGSASRFDGRLEDAILFLKANTNDCRYLSRSY